jgi:hypothetical protein
MQRGKGKGMGRSSKFRFHTLRLPNAETVQICAYAATCTDPGCGPIPADGKVGQYELQRRMRRIVGAYCGGWNNIANGYLVKNQLQGNVDI